MIILSVAAMVSCGNKTGGLKPKQLAITGPLGKYFEVVEREYKIIKEESVEAIYIEVRRIKEGLPEPWQENFGKEVGFDDGKIEPCLTAEFYDADGNIVGKMESSFSNRSDFQQMIDLAIDESSSIHLFTFDDLRSPSSFKVSGRIKYHGIKDIDKDIDDEYEEPADFPARIRLHGALMTESGKEYPIVMALNFSSRGSESSELDVSGYYFYASKSEDNNIKLNGTLSLDDSTMKLVSDDSTETFGGELIDFTMYSGTWKMSKNGKVSSLTFNLEDVELQGTDADDNTQKSSVKSSKRNVDVAKLIDKYEELVKKFMSIQKNDGVLNFALYAEAQELEEEINEAMDDCPEELSDRFFDLSMKLSKAYLFGTK